MMATPKVSRERASSLPAKPVETVATFERSVLDALKAYQSHIKKETLPEDQKQLAGQDFAGLLKYMGSAESNALSPPPLEDFTHPISSYYVSTSHNTYLTGHQLYGKATVDGYKNVLLRGCRCVEIDCWDGEAEGAESGKIGAGAGQSVEPVVLHGHTATRQITFRSVCETIREYAFVASEFPLIVSLEVHTNHQQQQLMVDIMRECFADYLCPGELDDWTEPGPILPSPEALRKKILIKVKYSPLKTPSMTEEDALEMITQTSDLSLSDGETASITEEKVKKPSKIIEALSKMGIYTRSYHYGGFTKPEASIPTHVFSLSESSVIGVHKTDPQGLFDHNKKYLMRAYPKGMRISSSNLDPCLFWRVGVQMVALNWQSIDKGMMLQEGMFQATGGWVVKPANHLVTAKYQDSLVSLRKGRSSLRITFLAAQGLPSGESDKDDKLRPYVKCEIHVDTTGIVPSDSLNHFRKPKELGYKLKTDVAKGKNPTFSNRDALIFGSLPPLVPQLSFARFKVMHDKFGPDEFLAWACIRLDRLRPGIRLIHLFDLKGESIPGVLLVKIEQDWNLPH